MPLELKGVFVPNITPFTAQGVDEAGLRKVLDYLIEGGASGLVPCGTTGESATLTHAEHRRVTELTIQHAAGRVPVIAGAGSNCTTEAVDLVKHAEQAGADAALVICPYYNKPTQAGLIAHFEVIAEAVAIPILIYNIPGRTGVNMEPSTVARLSQHPGLVGIKEASGDLKQVMDIIHTAAPGFSVLSGDGILTFLICCLGGTGGILADAHILPGEWRRMVELIAAGKIGEAREIHYRLAGIGKTLFVETNPAPAKAALELLGVSRADTRLPLLPATDACREALRKELKALGLL